MTSMPYPNSETSRTSRPRGRWPSGLAALAVAAVCAGCGDSAREATTAQSEADTATVDQTAKGKGGNRGGRGGRPGGGHGHGNGGGTHPPAPANEAPTADAGSPQTVFVGSTVQLDGSASRDPESSPLTYDWSVLPPEGSRATLTGPGAGPNFVADVPGTYLLSLNVSDGSLSSSTPATVKVLAVPLPADQNDRNYRVIVEPDRYPTWLPLNQDWYLQFKYTVPAKPPGFDHRMQTLYIWGDIDFDAYGSNLSGFVRYAYNQIAPQLILGSAVSGNDANYTPRWAPIEDWLYQAHYYWQDDAGRGYALTGSALPIWRGDVLTTRIEYSQASGAITATITGRNGTSSIVIPRPFPNENPPRFATWREFFNQAAASLGESWIRGRPAMNVETYFTHIPGVCSMLPWQVSEFDYTGFVPGVQGLFVAPTAGLTCAQDLATVPTYSASNRQQ